MVSNALFVKERIMAIEIFFDVRCSMLVFLFLILDFYFELRTLNFELRMEERRYIFSKPRLLGSVLHSLSGVVAPTPTCFTEYVRKKMRVRGCCILFDVEC